MKLSLLTICSAILLLSTTTTYAAAIPSRRDVDWVPALIEKGAGHRSVMKATLTKSDSIEIIQGIYINFL
jgi:hypothetical protein